MERPYDLIPWPSKAVPSNHTVGRQDGVLLSCVQLESRYDLVRPGSVLAIDCEGVLLSREEGWRKNGCGRVSIVNEHEEVVYDTFVHYGRNVEHRPPPQSRKLGVEYNDIRPRNGAQHINQVTRVVTALLDRAGVVVGHAVKNEMQYLRDVPWERYQIRDTQWMPFSETDSLKLQKMASAVLGRLIQIAEHSSVEDAQATMALYLSHRAKPTTADPHDSTVGSVSDEVGREVDNSDVSSGGPGTPISEGSGPVDPALEAHRAALPVWISDDTHLVALPNLESLAEGLIFDRRTSTWYWWRLSGMRC